MPNRQFIFVAFVSEEEFNSKVANHFTAVAAVEPAVQGGIDRVAEKSHCTVTHRGQGATRVKATGCKEASKVYHQVRDTAVRRAVAIGERADGTRMSP